MSSISEQTTNEVAMKKVFTLQDIKVYADDDTRKFSGYASTFGNTDRVGDVVEKGAFNKSLNKHNNEKTMPAMLLHHDMHRPIGKWIEMKEEELIEKTHDERDAQIEIDNQRLKAMLSKLNSIKSKQSNG